MKKSKRLIILLVLGFGIFGYSQKKKSPDKRKYNYIISTDNIQDIQEFLDTANHEDPRYPICKRRLIELKNKTWMHNGPISFMKARPLENSQQIIARNFVNEEEFASLMKKNAEKHNEKTVDLLNSMFNPDLNTDNKIILVQNNSDCNFIINFSGNEVIKLAVPAHGEDFVILKKGDYNISSNVCGANYESKKTFTENKIISFGYSVLAENHKN